MKVWKMLWGSAALLSCAVAPLSASSYVPRPGYGYNVFGFSNFGSYSAYSTITPAQTSSTTAPSALQTSSCLYNSCGGSAPGLTTSSTPSLTTSFASNPSASYSYPAYYGGVTRYSVFGMYNFRPGAFGATQQPAFSGGLTQGRVLADPLANPEPGTIVLFGAGLLALGWERRRRRLSRKA